MYLIDKVNELEDRVKELEKIYRYLKRKAEVDLMTDAQVIEEARKMAKGGE